MKTCTKCKLDKELDDFPKSINFKSGFNSICKKCINLHNKEYRDNNSEKFNNKRKEHYQKNIIKMREDKRKYYASHVKEKSEYDKTYRELNSKKISEYKKNWENINKDNPIFKIKRNLRSRVRHALEGKTKRDKTFELIGCTPNYFIEYIESQFKDGMSWDNYGEWHIDHIKECFRFDLNDENQQRECFHYTNQRPLWANENLTRKRNK